MCLLSLWSLNLTVLRFSRYASNLWIMRTLGLVQCNVGTSSVKCPGISTWKVLILLQDRSGGFAGQCKCILVKFGFSGQKGLKKGACVKYTYWQTLRESFQIIVEKTVQIIIFIHIAIRNQGEQFSIVPWIPYRLTETFWSILLCSYDASARQSNMKGRGFMCVWVSAGWAVRVCFWTAPLLTHWVLLTVG